MADRITLVTEDDLAIKSGNPLHVDNGFMPSTANSADNPMYNEIVSSAGDVVDYVNTTKKLTLNSTNGVVASADLFTVTGLIKGRLYAVCATNLAATNGPQVSAGVAGDLDALIAVTNAADVDANELWVNSTPQIRLYTEASIAERIIGGNIKFEISSATCDAGVVNFYLRWKPMTDGAGATAV